MYDKVFICFEDARKHIREDISRVASSRGAEGDILREELRAVDAAFTTMLVQQTVKRNKLLFTHHQVKPACQCHQDVHKADQCSKVRSIYELLDF